MIAPIQKTACPSCGHQMDYAATQTGVVVSCTGCGQPFSLPPAELEKPRLQCPRCGGHEFYEPRRRFTTAGIVTLLAGLLLAPVGIGLILIIVACTSMRENFVECCRCEYKF